MTFLGLAPAYVGLVGGIGLVVTVLLYLRQWGRRRVVVSFSPLWKRVMAESDAGTRQRRVLEVLSLLLQVAIVGLLALALGRPLLGRAPGTHVLVLDTSASMLARRAPRGTRLSAAKQAALELLDRVSDADRVALITTGGEARLLFAPTRDHYAVRDRILALEGCACDGRLREALDIAHGLTSDAHAVDIFTDGNESLGESDAGNANVQLFGAPTSNIGITVLGVRAAATTPGRYEGLLEVQSFAAARARGQLRVSIDGRLIQLVDVAVEPGERQIVTLPPLSPQGGEGLLKAELFNIEYPGAGATIDALAEDDVAYALLAAEAEYPIRLLAPTDKGRYVRGVLHANPRYRVVDVDPEKPDEAGAGTITVVADAAVPTGPGRYLVLGARSRPTTPLLDSMFTDWSADHPILRHVSLLDVRIKAGQAFAPPEGAQVLARFGDQPLVYVSQRVGRTEIGTTFDIESSNLPLRVAFPVLVYNTIDWMLGADELDAVRTLGRRWRIQRMSTAQPKIVSVEGPSRHADATVQGDTILVDNANLPGIYRVRADDETFRVAASLTSAHESDLRETTVTRSSTTPVARASDLWSLLVYAALLVLVVEWFLYHRRMTS